METLAEKFESGKTVKIKGLTYRKGINENSFYDALNSVKINEKDELMLKWGGFKGGRFKENPVAMKTLDEIGKAQMDDNQEKVKELTCRMIDEFNGKIYNCWDGCYFNNKQEAKDYVMNYKTTQP